MRYVVKMYFKRLNSERVRLHGLPEGGSAEESARWSDNVQARTPKEAAALYEAVVRENEPDILSIHHDKTEVKEYEDGFERSDS